jgi:hypothetical protein
MEHWLNWEERRFGEIETAKNFMGNEVQREFTRYLPKGKENIFTQRLEYECCYHLYS